MVRHILTIHFTIEKSLLVATACMFLKTKINLKKKKTKQNKISGLKGSGIHYTIVVGIIAVRYILLPLLGILIVKGAVAAGLVKSQDIFFQFVLMLQHALPPAMSIGR